MGGARRRYERNISDAVMLPARLVRSIMWRAFSHGYWHVGFQHSLSRYTMPLYISFLYTAPIVQRRSFPCCYVHDGAVGTIISRLTATEQLQAILVCRQMAIAFTIAFFMS